MKPIEEWLKELFPDMTEPEGEALWNAFVNRDVYTPDGQLHTYSFRMWGGIIADVRAKEEIYLDYYCSPADEVLIAEVESKLTGAGWNLLYDAKLCSDCGKPIERNDVVAIDIKNGTMSHALCGIQKRDSLE